jgi:predicted MPP superfamily phosphohydrolase
MNLLRWVHLSDIHFNFLNYRTQKMKDELLKHLSSLRAKDVINFLVITGDLVFKEREKFLFLSAVQISLIIMIRQIFW